MIVNAGVEPWELPNKLLLTEVDEIPAIAEEVQQMDRRRHRRAIGRSSVVNILEGVPAVFCFGPDHHRFFYPRVEYLYDRYRLLKTECVDRGLAIENHEECFEVDSCFYGNWIETPRARILSVERIEATGKRLRRKFRRVNLNLLK